MADRRDPFDPQVEEILRRGRKGPPEPEPEARQRRDRSWDAARSKATYDLPPSLIDDIKEVAAEIEAKYGKVKLSDVARLLLEAGLFQYRAGNLQINPKPRKFDLFDD